MSNIIFLCLSLKPKKDKKKLVIPLMQGSSGKDSEDTEAARELLRGYMFYDFTLPLALVCYCLVYKYFL